MAKKALLVGINRYSNPTASLRGCLNDVSAMSTVLTRNFGFKDIQMLLDNQATKANILDRLNWLVAGAQPGDSLVFHYSGHGSTVVLKDQAGNVVDAKEPIVCTYELNWANPLTFNEVGKALVAPEGVNITSIMDCCHSGHDFRGFKNPYFPGIIESGVKDMKFRFLPPPAEMRDISSLSAIQPRKLSDETDILLTGCGLMQTSADAMVGGMYRGAFTFSLVQALQNCGYKTDYINLLTNTIQVLRKNGFNQTPQLEGAVNKLGRWPVFGIGTK